MASSNLPDLTVVPPIDHKALTTQIASAAGIENLSPSDPAYRVALAVAYRESLVRQDANEQAKGVMLAYATGPQLDHLGDTYYRDVNNNPVTRLTDEPDEDYRVRLSQSFEGLSVAGPEAAYQFHARSYSTDIKDVDVQSPAPVQLAITLLHAQGDGSVDDALCQAVYDYLLPKRPLGDEVTVQSAQIIPFSVTASLILADVVDSALVMTEAQTALSAYLAKNHRLGGRVVESGIHAALTVPGVEEVRLTNWNDVLCQAHQAPYCSAATITEG